MDSSPPPSEESLGRPISRTAFSPVGRVAALEAEVERLKNERANDADETAGMLVQIAQSERMRAAAVSRADHADDLVTALQNEIESARERVTELEGELARAQREAANAAARLAAAQKALAGAGTLLGDLERREELAASARARTLREAMRVLGSGAAETGGPPEVDWDLDFISQEDAR
jgi:chromosome segregation ATPase